MKISESQPLVSIIIPHRNNYPILEECLESLKNISYQNCEIIVTDNGSTDRSSDKIKQYFPDINLVENKTNEGFAGGCNRGANHANGKYLLFLNNDTTHAQNWIEPLVNQLEQDDSIAAVQPKILNYFQRKLFDYAGGCGGHMDILCFPFARGRIFLEQEIDTGQYNEVKNIFWASITIALMIDIRSIGVFLPALVILLTILKYFHKSISFKNLLTNSFILILLTSIFVILFWPRLYIYVFYRKYSVQPCLTPTYNSLSSGMVYNL